MANVRRPPSAEPRDLPHAPDAHRGRALPHVVVTVPSGHVGVLGKRFGGGTVLDPHQLKDEGLHLVWLCNEVFL